MKIYVGLTDWDWYINLRSQNTKEVNFWKPSGKPFKALQKDDLFLFKLKAAKGGQIAGGGFFVDAPTTTIDWAWRAFGKENGVNSLSELGESVWHYKSTDRRMNPNATITCIILTDVFYLEQEDWIDISDNWSPSIVSGKTFKGREAASISRMVQSHLVGVPVHESLPNTKNASAAPAGVKLVTTKHRIGQGAFRTLVADAYQRRCAITGERTVPVLQAAHIKSFASEGPNSVDNGILLRSDMHALFDAGYITIEYDANHESRVVVSSKLHDDYGNGKDYYPYHGSRLAVVPEREILRPAKKYLEWHHENVFLG